jgi:hypothetical protein
MNETGYKNYSLIGWSVWLVVVVRILFCITYSPNVGGDGINYLRMLVNGGSNLIHASGYPFLIGFPWRVNDFFLRRLFIAPHPAIFLYVLIAFQHALSILVIWWLYRILRRVYGAFVAHATVLLWGLNYLSLESTSFTYPEWLQANLLVISILLAVSGVFAAAKKKKAWLYGTAAFAFAWCYLVKFNVLYFVLLFLIIFAFETRRTQWEFVGLLVVEFVAIFLSIIWGYKILYHQPSTGTYTLTHDHAWVLIDKVSKFVPEGKLHPEAGINTKRLLILNSILPWDNKNVGPIANVNFVSPEIENYRQKYLYLLDANETVIDDVFKETVIRKNFDLYTAFSPVAYYLGLREGDELGIRVFFENVWAYPWEYIRSILKGTLDNLTNLDVYRVFPSKVEAPQFQPMKFGFYSFDQSNLLHNGTDRYSNPTGFYVWKPGVQFFTFIVWLCSLPNILVVLLCITGMIQVSISISHGDKVFGEFAYLILGILVFGFILFSNAILVFRQVKEMVLVLPLISILVAISCSKLLTVIRNILRAKH